MPQSDALIVKMMGSFSLQYRGKELVLDRNTVSKTTQLLQVLVLNGEKGIAKTSLMDALYGREDVENKNGSLNSTIFRMRKQLKAAGLPESSYVTIRGGMCYWEKEIPVKVDAVEFEQTVREAEREQDQQKRVELMKAACKSYTGEFLPNMIGEDWVSVKNVYYRELYFNCVKELCQTLTAQEKFEEVHQLARAAADIYPFDEWQLWEIDSLISMARYKDAMEAYERTTKLMMDELGLSPSPEMLKRFQIMGERMSQVAGAIEDIKHRMEEKERRDGAYFCPFPSFVDIYHVFSRIMERKGISVYIMLCTLKNGKNQVCGEKKGRDRETSEILKEAIRIAMRRGDFYTRYNYSQYLILLSEISQENCRIVSDRINRRFREAEQSGTYKVDFYVTSVAEVCIDEMPYQEKKFKPVKKVWGKS